MVRGEIALALDFHKIGIILVFENEEINSEPY